MGNFRFQLKIWKVLIRNRTPFLENSLEQLISEGKKVDGGVLFFFPLQKFWRSVGNCLDVSTPGTTGVWKHCGKKSECLPASSTRTRPGVHSNCLRASLFLETWWSFANVNPDGKVEALNSWPLLNECGSNSGTLGSPFAFCLKCTSAHHKVEQTPLLPDPKSCSQPWTVSTLHPLDALLLLLTPSPSPVPIWIHEC